MERYLFRDNEILTIDLHHMKEWEAVIYLDNTLKILPSIIREVVVIHGYHNGNRLLNMVRKEYKNSRIKSKFLSLNQGVTSLILNQED